MVECLLTKPNDVAANMEFIYEAECFAKDHTTLEVRSIQRPGETKAPEIKNERCAFFDQKLFVEKFRIITFDSDNNTGFYVG